MNWNWLNPSSWPVFNGSIDNSIPIEYGTINGIKTIFSLDSYGVGSLKHTHFPNNFREYVRLQRDIFPVQNAIGKIGKLLSQVEFTSEKDNDKLVNKLNNPNEYQSKEEFLKEFATYVKSAGWTAIWKRYKSYGSWDSLELININPDTADFNKSKDSLIFEHDDEKYTIKLTEIILFYDSVRLKNNKGYSVLKPLRSQIKNILDAQQAKGIQIENSGTTIVSAKAPTNQNVVDEGINAIVTPDLPGQVTQKQVIEAKLNHRGIENRIVVASKPLDALNLSAGLNAFKFDETVEADILAIFDAFGIPVELTPYGKNNTYDNKKVAELSLLQGEIIPLASSLVNSIKSEFPDRGNPDFSFDHLECMSLVRERIEKTNTEKISQVSSLMNMGLIDDNKAKQMLKYIIPE